MLGKLMKHEWLRMWKVPTLLLVFLNIMAIIAGMTTSTRVWGIGVVGENFFRELIMVLFIAGVIGVAFSAYVYFAVNFYKSTYSDEGYLLHTLPVTPRQILITKTVMIALWQVIVFVGVISALFLWLVIGGKNLGLNWQEVVVGISLLKTELKAVFAESYPSVEAVIILMLLQSLVSVIYTGVFLTSSITFGQLAKKHRIGAAILAGVASNVVISSVVSFCQIPFFAGTLVDSTTMGIQSFFLSILVGMIIQILATVLLYMISEYILTKKLNLE
ncbi:MAG: hypothetical protein IKL49_02500 [Lachnospiraceae bacterium]|nr:hypothetical protein [Lachnospiraceae bacterium]